MIRQQTPALLAAILQVQNLIVVLAKKFYKTMLRDIACKVEVAVGDPQLFQFPGCQNQQDNKDGHNVHHKSLVICTNLQFIATKQALPLINQRAARVTSQTYVEVTLSPHQS